jgi:hypothetical protein
MDSVKTMGSQDKGQDLLKGKAKDKKQDLFNFRKQKREIFFIDLSNTMVREEIQKIDKQMTDKKKVMSEYEKDIREDE